MHPKRGTTAATEFGERLRQLRVERHMTLSAAARGIGVSVPYWSDVEHGRRNPFTGEKLEAVARMLDADFDELHRLALSARRTVEIPLVERSPKQADLIVTFARTIGELTEPDLDEIHRILERRRNESKR